LSGNYGRLAAALRRDDSDHETTSIAVCRVVTGGVPSRHASSARGAPPMLPVQQTRSRIRNGSLGHFSRAHPGHFWRALKPQALDSLRSVWNWLLPIESKVEGADYRDCRPRTARVWSGLALRPVLARLALMWPRKAQHAASHSSALSDFPFMGIGGFRLLIHLFR